LFKAVRLIHECVYHLKEGSLTVYLCKKWRTFRNRRRKTWWKVHEKGQNCFVNAFLREGDVFVDVGANVGLFSIIAGRRVSPSGRVFAFEPAKNPYLELSKNVALNRLSNVLCIQKALSDTDGTKSLFASGDGFDDYNSFAQPIADASFAPEEVSCTTWDAFAGENGLRGKVTMMKIDVEGWETRLLQGGRESFSREDAPLLQVEFTDEASVSAGSSCDQLYNLLEDLGYTMFVYNHEKREIVREPLRASYPYLNLIATKHPSSIGVRLRERNPFKRLFQELNWC
jgi:FkbM family methyltransferase